MKTVYLDCSEDLSFIRDDMSSYPTSYSRWFRLAFSSDLTNVSLGDVIYLSDGICFVKVLVVGLSNQFVDGERLPMICVECFEV